MSPQPKKTIHKVSSVDEAVALALKFKESGKYDVFRGQARNWPVVSSLHRDNSKNFERNKDKIERFYYFLSKKTELKKYLDNVHEVFAIAQHYGLATPYIDFTSSPAIAAFFATNSKKNKLGQIATIICVNSRNFASVVDFIKSVVFKNHIPAEFITIDVANLWRLQAQEGCFLYAPFSDIEHIYDFDRIEFPFTCKYDKIQHSQVYPARKSSLEIILDNYFQNERLIDWQETVETIFPELHKTSVVNKHSIFHYIDTQTQKHSSWLNKKISDWQMPKQYRWNNIQSPQCLDLNIYTSKSLQENFNELHYLILKTLDNKKLNRDFLASFSIIRHPRNINKKGRKEIENGCTEIWDGVRALPYTNEQVAKCIARYIVLFLSHTTSGGTSYFSLIPSAIYIAMNCHDGSYTRAHVCGYKVLSAIRDNIDDKVLRKHKKALTNNPVALVQCVNIPQYLFKFQRLCDLFAEDIIPTQLVLKRNPVYFNPAHIKILGLA